jgi:hypothetical protein
LGGAGIGKTDSFSYFFDGKSMLPWRNRPLDIKKSSGLLAGQCAGSVDETVKLSIKAGGDIGGQA